MKINVKILSFVVIMIMLSVALSYFYLEEKQPATTRFGSVNISLVIMHNAKLISTNYIITRNGYFYATGKTLDGGAVLVSVPNNSTYTISSDNTKNQNYYTASKTFSLNSELKPYYVNLKLRRPGTINLFPKLNKTASLINITIKSNGYYNDLSYCINWGTNIIYANSDTKLSKNYFPSYVKCYDAKKSLSNSNYSFGIKYKKWDDDKDGKITIFAFDKIYENSTIKYKNVGGKDLLRNIVV